MQVGNSDNYFLLIGKGDMQAFERLFKAYYPRLVHFAIRYVNDSHQAEDIVQDAFASLWETRERIKGSNIVPYIFVFVRNACLNQLKHQVVRQQFEAEILKELEVTETLYRLDMAHQSELPLLCEEIQQQIDKVLSELPERTRQIFVLSRFEGLKNREIAEKLHISHTAVERHLSKAIQRFSRQLSGLSLFYYLIMLF